MKEQVVVITGGSRGIGREAAMRFARAGSSVVILARGEAALVDTVEAIQRDGGIARYIVCDVTDAAGVAAAVHQVEQWFGRIDTWVGNAGVLLYAPVAETTASDLRLLFEVNVVGQLHGIQAAVPALRRAGGGTFVAVSSTEAVVTLPLHSGYAASKHAVEGLLDGLRRELRTEAPEISVTAVRPAVIDTPIYRHARNRLSRRPTGPRPHYSPSVVAEAIVFAATHRVRTIHAGGGARFFTAGDSLVPSVMDSLLGRFDRFMHTSETVLPSAGNLEGPLEDVDPHGGLPGRGRWSVYTWLRVHPLVRVAVMSVAVGAGVRSMRIRRV
ncbi:MULTISPECIES: SDR family oxidoreductase [unclassified Microbacterium]|uniref:SDR family oxidoreductase n=1 Tax=unclassified Microbacterium TaxID=2609290 RepID=UPI00160307AD|nr:MULTISPECIES: SDR family oxidoreductase [unclassified Microbacterium]MBT2485291.1 SDR family NAD(P)-dependent oxidoreductase [Microbacterium sp. ISL-108]